MPDNALYVYGIVKSKLDLKWKWVGLNKKDVYTIKEGEFSALVHDCEEKPYISKDPNKIKELIIDHNKILDRAMKFIGGVIPLHFNTIIIKKGEKLPQDNLKKWLKADAEKLEKIWNKIKNKKEYGIKIYCEKENLIQEVSNSSEIKRIKENQQEKSEGLSYLLEGKVNSKINEFVQNEINQFKQRCNNDIGKITDNIKVNISRIYINEEKDLLLSLSVLVNEQEITRIKQIFRRKTDRNFSFRLAGPFAPYSFVEK